MPRDDRAHGVWHTTRQKRHRRGAGKAITHTSGPAKKEQEATMSNKKVDIQALLAYVRESAGKVIKR